MRFCLAGLNDYVEGFWKKTRINHLSDQITQDQSKYQGNLKLKDPNMMIQFARITYSFLKN
jgi:hypothetical protein